MPEPLREMDLQAYVDGQLDAEARAEVEGQLAQDPEAAARVMADLHLMGRLRAALAPAGDFDSRMTQMAARRFDRARSRDRLLRRWGRMLPLGAAVAILALALPLGLLQVPSVTASSLPPVFVSAAISAHEASHLRLQMRSQPEVRELDAEELRAATGILLPEFPRTWQLLDVQVFPSPDGPGIEMVFETPSAGLVTAFAVRPGDFALAEPVVEPWKTGTLAWMRMGETAHVLVSQSGDAAAIHDLASGLYDALR